VLTSVGDGRERLDFGEGRRPVVLCLHTVAVLQGSSSNEKWRRSVARRSGAPDDDGFARKHSNAANRATAGGVVWRRRTVPAVANCAGKGGEVEAAARAARACGARGRDFIGARWSTWHGAHAEGRRRRRRRAVPAMASGG
jgi:hypothetical protein